MLDQDFATLEAAIRTARALSWRQNAWGDVHVLRVISLWLFLALLLLTGANAHATEFWHTAHVLRVHPLADGTIVLMFTSDGSNCPSTTTPKQYRITIGQNSVTSDGLRAMQTTALTALATGVRLSVAFDNGTTNCYVNRAYLTE